MKRGRETGNSNQSLSSAVLGLAGGNFIMYEAFFLFLKFHQTFNWIFKVTINLEH